MTNPTPPPSPPTAAAVKELEQMIPAIADSLADFKSALREMNDPEWPERFQATLIISHDVIERHKDKLSRSVADDFSGIRSQFARFTIPREDELGPNERLKLLRNARGGLLAEIDELLVVAKSYGFEASQLEEVLPDSQVIERAGFELMLGSLDERLRKVEKGLEEVSEASRSDNEKSPQQEGLVNFYVQNLSIDVAMARVEATASELIDFSALARSIEGVVELTGDFLATIHGMPGLISDRVTTAADKMKPLVTRVSKGFRTIIKRATKPFVRKPDQRVPEPVTTTDEPIDPPTSEEIDDSEFWSLIEAGDHHKNAGRLAEARAPYERAFNIAEKEAKTTDSPKWQQNLATGHTKLGDVELSAGYHLAARARFEDSRAIAETMAKADPGEAEWQRALLVSYNRLGTVELAVGDVAAARDVFASGLAIAETLTEAEPGNAELQRDLSISYNKIGAVEIAVGDFAAARRRFEASLAIRENLAKSETDKAQWQRDLSVAYNCLADVEFKAGDLETAREHAEESLALVERLANTKPSNTLWQNDMSISLERLGDIAKAEGSIEEARSHFFAKLEIDLRLAELDSSNTKWQRDLWISYWRLADLDHPNYPWSRVLAELEEMQAAGTLFPSDEKYLHEARRLAAKQDASPDTSDTPEDP
ncbi:MAG: tetratricopeptide repeat protein [Pseudomonadota bacterium]